MRKDSKPKQKVYIKFLKNKNLEDELICKTYKNRFEKIRKKSKQNYYSNLLEKHKDNTKQRWQVLQEITEKVQKSLLTTLEFETAYKSLKRNKTSGIDDYKQSYCPRFIWRNQNPIILYFSRLAKKRSCS